MKIIFPRMETTHFHRAYDGGCKYIQQIGEELVKKGHEVTIVTTRLRKDNNLKEAYHKGVRHVFIKPKYTGTKIIPFNMFYKMIFSWNLKKYLKNEEFDILHNSEAFALFYLLNKDRKKVIFQSWALEPFYGDECMSQKGIKKLYVKLFLQKPWMFCLKRADCVTADKEFQIPRIMDLGIKRNKIDFIPNGIYFEDIQKLREIYKDKRKELGFKEDDLVLLSVSQLVEDKGIIELLNSFKLTKKEIPNLKLIIIGKGILEDKVKSFIKTNNFEKDIIHLKDIPESDLFNYHFSSDIFINAVRTNNLMLSIQEAMACGLPIVSSAQPFLVKDGVNGYVVGINNENGLSEGVLKIIRNKEIKEMGKESIKLVQEYDWKNVVDSAERIYRRLLNGERE
jgi:glycosyltransferase involved in cell wall biosynthesis